MNKIPGWAWVGGAAILIALIWLSHGGSWSEEPPIQPGVTGTGDRTAQRPKARPWRG